MSNTITEFLKRLSTDTTFREFAQTQPDSAISSYSMTPDEKRAVRSLLEKSEQGREYKTQPSSSWH